MLLAGRGGEGEGSAIHLRGKGNRDAVLSSEIRPSIVRIFHSSEECKVNFSWVS